MYACMYTHACTLRCRDVWKCALDLYIVMAYISMAYMVVASIVMAYMVMAYIVMAYTLGLCARICVDRDGDDVGDGHNYIGL